MKFPVLDGYLVLFLWILGEQLGLPIPSSPLLFAADALTATGRMSFVGSISIAVTAAQIGDLFWYQAGHRHRTKALGRPCRLSPEPISCVRRAETFFEHHGSRSLLVVKFIPGLTTIAAPIAGAIRTPALRFLLFDSLGMVFWVAAFETLGYACANQLEKMAASASRIAALALGVGVIGLAVAYTIRKSAKRRHFLASLRMARITVQELKAKIDAHQDIAVIDLRHPLDFLPQPYTIP